MAFLLFMTTWAMVGNLIRYYTESQVLLLGVGGVVFVLELWLAFEAVLVFRKRFGAAAGDGPEDMV
jgi:hypothetical protein